MVNYNTLESELKEEPGEFRLRNIKRIMPSVAEFEANEDHFKS